MNGWRKPCEHGCYDAHGIARPSRSKVEYCPGGSPVTAADLEGETVWWCERHQAKSRSLTDKNYCQTAIYELALGRLNDDCDMVERLLIPIPDPQPATEGT